MRMNNNGKEDLIPVERINVISDFQIEIGHEDSTLMAPLQHLISSNYESNDVEIAGYSKLHPSDNKIVLRVQFKDQSKQISQEVLLKTIEGCDLLCEVTDTMLHKLKELRNQI